MTEIPSIIAALRLIQEDAAARPGAVHHWKKGDFQKQRDGQWKQIVSRLAQAARAVKSKIQRGFKKKPAVAADVPASTTPTKIMLVTHTPLPVGRKWIDKAVGVPADTLAEHSNPDGSIKAERKPLHEAIKAKFLEGPKPVPADQSPIAILTMGLPAAGKSFIVRGLPKDQFVKVDPDAIREMIPEYQEAISQAAKNAGTLSHEEASMVAKQIKDEAIRQRKNVIIDGSGKNPKSYMENIQKLRAQGYTIKLILPDIDVPTSKARAATRAEKEGRWVPDSFIEEVDAKVRASFNTISKEIDSFSVFDSRVPPPILKWEKEGDKIQIHDEAFVKEFHKKAGAKAESLVAELRSLLETPMSNKKPPSIKPADLKKIVNKAMTAGEEDLKKKPKKFRRGEGIDEPDKKDV